MRFFTEVPSGRWERYTGILDWFRCCMSGRPKRSPGSPPSKRALWASLRSFSASQPPRKMPQIEGTRDLTKSAPTPVPRKVFPNDLIRGFAARTRRTSKWPAAWNKRDSVFPTKATGAKAMWTFTLRAKSANSGRENAANPWVVPCEWDTYDRVSDPVASRMYLISAGRSKAAISSQEKSQNSSSHASNPSRKSLCSMEYVVPRLFPVAACERSRSQQNKKIKNKKRISGADCFLRPSCVLAPSCPLPSQTSYPKSARTKPRDCLGMFITHVADESISPCCSKTGGFSWLPGHGRVSAPCGDPTMRTRPRTYPSSVVTLCFSTSYPLLAASSKASLYTSLSSVIVGSVLASSYRFEISPKVTRGSACARTSHDRRASKPTTTATPNFPMGVTAEGGGPSEANLPPRRRRRRKARPRGRGRRAASW
mmetsp:Transcript_4646/g.13867  ORF Transcript_4646/g.13867 Transcript_4646/m.13867 type:complete len:425 (+) Transcript_4646:382-1656(+)